jgi:hypothetical protein
MIHTKQRGGVFAAPSIQYSMQFGFTLHVFTKSLELCRYRDKKSQNPFENNGFPLSLK